MLLEVLLGGGDDLDGGELVALLFEAGDDVADEATLIDMSVFQISSHVGHRNKIWVGGVRTWTPSGLMAMKL